MIALTPTQIVAAALHELLADQPDLAEVRTLLSDIPADKVYAVGSALVQMAGMCEYLSASARVRAGAR